MSEVEATASIPEFAPKKDVTEQFAAACGKLAKGEMVRCPEFELSRAISAVEFFSPKMDVGLLPTRPAPSTYKLGFAKMTEAEACAMIDHLWFQELLHLDGATQVQSIFTCLALDQAQISICEKENPKVHALLMHTLQFCEMNHALVARTQVCFEEDFTLNSSYGIEIPGVSEFKDNLELKKLDGALEVRIQFRRLLAEISSQIELCEFEDAEQKLKQCSTLLSKIQCTTEVENPNFDQQVNLFRILPQPPKPFSPYVPGEVTKRFQEILLDLEQICTVRHHADSLTGLFSRLCWLTNRPTLNSFTRSRLFHTLINNDQQVCGKKKWENLVLEDIDMGYGAPAVLALESVLLPTLQAVFETFRVLCFNLARQKRRLVHRIEEFGTLTQQFEILDGKANAFEGDVAEWEYTQKQQYREQYKFPLGNWGLEWCLRFQIRFMELGAMPGKMDLVRPNDVPNHVYYLYYLYRTLVSYEVRRAKVSQPHVTGLLECKRLMCLASIQFLIGVTHSTQVFANNPLQQAVFDFPRIKFEHRFFDPFSTVCLPKPLSCYEMYMSYNSQIGALTPQQIFDQAENTFKNARELCSSRIQHSDETKGFARLAIMNSVACATAKTLQPGMKLDLQFKDFGLGHVALGVQKQQ